MRLVFFWVLVLVAPSLAQGEKKAEPVKEPADVPKTKISPKDGAEMIFIPAGDFLMGQNKSRVNVAGFWMYKTEVTVAQYRKFCGAAGRAMPAVPAWGWHDDHPIVNVNWNDAKAYCDWAGVKLPTAEQWEKAARGTDGRVYPWGNTFDTSRMRCSTNILEDAVSTAPVGSYPTGASPYGCLDMAGNAYEWCEDKYDDKDRVDKGGSWGDVEPFCFWAARQGHLKPDRVAPYGGFRCASNP